MVAALASAGSPQPRAAAALRHCADLRNEPQTATRIVAHRLTCRIARLGVKTYLGAPQSCITGTACGQSGVGTNTHSFVSCHRRRHFVRCTVVYPPRPRGSVRFVVHPIGYPGLQGTQP